MKTNMALTLLFISFAITGCKKLGVNFSINNQANFRVESSSPINLPFEMGTPDVTTNSSQQFDNNNTAANLIKEIKLEELKLSITNPATKTFSFLKSVDIYISTNSNNEILLASLSNISSTAQSISLTTTAQDLSSYVKASSYKLRTSVVTKETITQAIDIRADIKFKVKAGLL